MALQTIAALYQREARPVLKDVKAFLLSSVMSAHQQIMRYAGTKAMLDTPRTTVVAAVLQGSTAHWVHCGDSRLYVVRDGALLTRTRDHSHAERPRPGGGPEPVNRNLLLTCLGSPTPPMIDVAAPLQLQRGDRIMLCSDGVWGVLDDALIVHALLRQAGVRRGTRPRRDGVAQGWLAQRQRDAHRARVGNARRPGHQPRHLDRQHQRRRVRLHDPGRHAVGHRTRRPDEDAIERSIAEINEAIRRSAARKA